MLDKSINEYTTLSDLKSLLESNIADLIRELDALDGSFDGKVSTKLLNEWRESQGLNAAKFGTEFLPLIDAIKYVNEVQSSELAYKNIKPENN